MGQRKREREREGEREKERERVRGGRERERDRKKVTFQQIFAKTFLFLLPLSALLKHYSPPIPPPAGYFESLRGGPSIEMPPPTKSWLMFKEKIMEKQCRGLHKKKRIKSVFHITGGIRLNNI